MCNEVENSSQKSKHYYTNNIGLVLEEQIPGKRDEALNSAHVFLSNMWKNLWFKHVRYFFSM
jgi:hypothetical protein